MRRCTLLLAAVCCAGTFAPVAVRGEALDEKTRVAVDHGLHWLAVRWDPAAPEAQVAAQRGGPIAATALSGLALLAAGDDKPGEGRYGAALKNCLDTVLANQQRDGLFVTGKTHGPMYAHAFATLLVAEVFGRWKDPALKEPLERAVGLIERSQNEEGGWRYQPQPFDADVSVTACQMGALHAAERAGVTVNANVISRGRAYVRACQNADDGGFRYMAKLPKNGSGLPRSAAAVTVLAADAKPDDADLIRGQQFLAKALAGDLPAADGRDERKPFSAGAGHFFYAAYFASRALWQAGGEYRAKQLPICRDALLAIQKPDGSWDGDFSSDYATAMALIALQVSEERIQKPAGPAAVKPAVPKS
jgi:hypothetical protein